MIRKLAVVGVIVTGVVMLTAGAAFAHVEIERDGDVSAQGVVQATLSVPNESTTQGTKTIELVFPDSPKLTTATAEDANGFTAPVNKDGAGDVTSITWTGGTITGDEEKEFPVTLGDFPADTETVEFKALQTYDDGTVVRWIEPTPAGGEEPEHPAPAVKLAAKAEGDGDHAAMDANTASTNGEHTEAAAATSDNTARWLGGAGLLVGAIGLGVGAGATIRARKATAKPGGNS